MSACTCINGVALHEGHCCLADLPADATMVACHPAEWTVLRDQLRERVETIPGTRDRLLTGRDGRRWVSRHCGPWEALRAPVEADDRAPMPGQDALL